MNDTFLTKQKEDTRRVIIIDYNHLAHKFRFGQAKALSVQAMVNGVIQVVDTTIPAYTIKQIVRWSQFGLNPTVVCFDSPIKTRKYAMKQAFSSEGLEGEEYKGERIKRDDSFYQGMGITSSLLHQGGVHVLKVDNYEADDLVFAAVLKAKEDYPGLPIDVITNDWDLAPLCDDQVSVYVRSIKQTVHTTGPKREKYVQVTPNTYAALVNATSAFKGKHVPYNSMLLWKILRGDKSDNIPGLAKANGKGLKWTPKKMQELLSELEEDGHDLSHYFRYGACPTHVIHVPTGNKYTREEVYKTDLPLKEFKLIFEDPIELTETLELLKGYVDQEDLDFYKTRYKLMNLNGPFIDVPQSLKRAPITITRKIEGFDLDTLQSAVDVLQIKVKSLLGN